jgi:hypothetical protein
MQGDLFWKLHGLSDAALIDGLSRSTCSGRRMLAELLAHLCEVEARRLHLDAGYPSLFAYCVSRLGFSEDEAYRRVEVARLARRVPAVFRLIAEGRLSLSAAALLKPHMLASNLAELVDAVSGKTVQAAREALATIFPRPDVPSSIRKLPAAAAVVRELTAAVVCTAPSLFEAGAALESGIEKTPPAPVRAVPPPTLARAVEPLATDRYKIQFTADAELQRKLELARDLLRHTLPSGDFGAIIGRALDLLVDEIMKRRFGMCAGPGRGSRATRSPHDVGAVSPRAGVSAGARTTPLDGSRVPGGAPEKTRTSTRVSRGTRRAVVERDGLRCAWHGPDGRRCDARAWLEVDHVQPRGLGGASDTRNLRVLCRSHNQRAAELAYGQQHVRRAMQCRGCHRKVEKRQSP